MLISSIVTLLLNWIQINTEYNTKNFDVEIFQVSIEEIQEKACNGNCPIIAFFKPDEGIYIVKMEFKENYCNQSILLHEIIHTLQNKKMENSFRESEAYLIQNKFLYDMSLKNNLEILNVKKCRSQQKL